MGSHAKHNTEQTFRNGLVLPFGVIGLLRNIPLFVGLDQRSEVGSTRVSRRVELFSKVVCGVQGDGRTGEVHQAKRPQANAESFAGNSVNLGGVRNPFLKQKAGFVQPRDEESIDDETWPVGANDDNLAQHFAVLNDLFNRFGTRCLGRNNLDEAVLRRMVKEMQANKSIRSAGGFCEGVDGQRRGVGRQNRVLAASLIQRIEHVGFDLKVLKHSLDDKVRVLRCVLNADHARNSRLYGFNLARGKNTALDRFVEELPDDGLSALNPLLLTVDHLDIKLFLSAFLGDT